MYTSKTLSKKLKEGGCELESEWFWQSFYNSNLDFVLGEPRKSNKYNCYPAYDILNDICVKYAKEFFGEQFKKFNVEDLDNKRTLKYGRVFQYRVVIVSLLLQQNKIQEAEDYIWKHCKFNKKGES